MSGNLKLPVGIDDFRKIRECGFYYVDKTKLVEQLMQNWGGKSVYQTKKIWQDVKYEHAQKLF